MDKVNLVCTTNNMAVPANLVNKTEDFLKVHLPASDSIVTLKRERTMYIGRCAGLEFSCDGKILKD